MTGRVLITGASGFIGRACVAEALSRGLEVVAVVRGSAPDLGPDVTVLRSNLSLPGSVNLLKPALKGCTGVIHAAAHLGGDESAIEADTLTATGNLLAALPQDMRLVLVSSITVYDTGRAQPGDSITEDWPLFLPGQAPDAYANAKLAQEAQARLRGAPLWILRPGAVWGPGRTWHALNGVDAGPLHLTLTSGGELPIAHVTRTAHALVAAALTDPGEVRAINVIDDDRPTRDRFVTAHRAATGWPRLALPLPWGVWAALARALVPVAHKVPGLLREPVLKARIMPLRWPNTALREALGGADTDRFETLLHASQKGPQ
ncbi:NADH(P)-binding protein [Salipiger pallidus]|uniref:NADH(P)-binding protein n=1 Tax=Salipiger pallidus TaxID=1775170 RepID=A0A8J3EHZ4_9RHOB|nr:NAD(P)-dependent oxidoreductase [Salipiger pallidus]GGG78324.1 NADH(P)-binding protein [Salipiger pallidus]